MLMILKKYNVTQVIIECFHVPPAVCLRTPRGTRTPGWESLPYTTTTERQCQPFFLPGNAMKGSSVNTGNASERRLQRIRFTGSPRVAGTLAGVHEKRLHNEGFLKMEDGPGPRNRQEVRILTPLS